MNFVQDGPRQTKIVYVGEAPGTAEAASGIPFQGGAGQLLSHCMSRVGLERHSAFMTNVCHIQPPGNKFEWFYLKANQAHYLRGVLRLKADLEEIRPNIVVALGGHALRALTGKKGIDKWRGSILSANLVPGLKVVGTYHPAYALRVYEAKKIIEWDLMRVKQEMETPEILLPQRKHYLAPDEVTMNIVAAEMMNAEWLSCDIECVPDEGARHGWRLDCVGFSDRADRSLVIPWNTPAQRLIIRQLLTNKSKKIFQNGMFDTMFLADHVSIEVTNFAWDTMLAHHALYAEAASGADEMAALSGKKRMSVFKKGLGFQASIYTREPYYKDDGKVGIEGKGDKMEFYLYNGKDAAVTREIKDAQTIEIQHYGIQQSFETEHNLLAPLLFAQRRGVLIDMNLRKQLISDNEQRVANLQAALDTAAGRPINVKSTAAGGDMQTLLYDILNLPEKRNKKTGRRTSDKNAVNELAGKHNHPVLSIVLKIREYRDLLERYLAVPLDADGRMRCAFDITGTRSGRLSSRETIYGTGTNLQNIPTRKKEGEQIRGMFIADPGKVFIYRDFSQAEARVVAYLARCQGLIELFEDPSRDIHKENAARIFNKDISDIADYPERYLAKRVVHASNYGMGGVRLVQVVNEDAATTGVRLTISEADQLIFKYFMLYPELKENYWREVCETVRDTRVLYTPFGRRREFFGRLEYGASYMQPDNLLREALSYIPQSTVGDLCNIAVANCYRDVQLGRPELGAEFLLAVHDSILMQCNEDKVYETAAAMEAAMNIPMELHGKTFRIPTDCKVGTRWCSAKTMPGGLVDISKWEKAA